MSRTLLRPPPLRPGATIGVFTPSFPAHATFPDRYRHGVAQLQATGFTVREGTLTRRHTSQGYRSGSPQQRAAELMDLFLDPDVDGLVATIGGNNSSSLLPFLDFDAIRAHPKVLCGYSDVTSLHMALLAGAGLSTFYGPAVAPSWGEWPGVLPETLESFLAAVRTHTEGERVLTPPDHWSRVGGRWHDGSWRTQARTWEPHDGWRVLRPGRVEAPLIVANLNTLCCLMGTPWVPDLSGCVLLLETMDLDMAIEERNLRQLQLAGVFDRLAGLLIGRVEFPDDDAPFSLDDLILEVVGPQDYPIVADLDCCHTKPMLTLAQRVPVRVVAPRAGPALLTLLGPMVRPAA